MAQNLEGDTTFVKFGYWAMIIWEVVDIGIDAALITGSKKLNRYVTLTATAQPGSFFDLTTPVEHVGQVGVTVI